MHTICFTTKNQLIRNLQKPKIKFNRLVVMATKNQQVHPELSVYSTSHFCLALALKL